MAKVIHCADGGLVCRASVRGESDDEVLAKAVEHAKEEHGVDLSSSKTLANYARTLIRDEDE